jgi:penicillin amidase
MATLPGPHGPIAYERDTLGYPRIRARDADDAAFARGFLHATDRLVQIQLSLVAARGRLMQVLGDKPFSRRIDRAVRSFGFATDLDEQVGKLGPKTRAWLQAYCDGMNQGAVARGWPIVLRLIGVPAEPFTIGSIVLIYRLVSFFGLTSMVQTAELLVTELAARGAPRSTFDLLLGGAADGIDLESLTGARVPRDVAFLEVPLAGGSNAFAVAGRASATGGALLMGEFHMETARFPPILYACHVDYDGGGYHQGIGVPGFAWLSAGRTPHVGWSYTYAHGDDVDVLVERCEDGRYLAAGEWRPFDERTERVKVRGKKDEEWTFYANPYGTLLGDARKKADLPCVRWSGLGEIARDLEACRAMLDAKNVRELADLHRDLRVISLEAVLADVHGDVACVHTGQVDRRPDGWTGAYPRKGWDLASRTPDVLAEEARPIGLGADRVASANQRVDGPNGEVWCTLPEPRYRHARIAKLLAAEERIDLRRLVEISYDEHDGCAARLLPVWAPHLPRESLVDGLVRWGAEQRSRQNRDGRRMLGLFHALHGEVVREVLAPLVGERQAARMIDELYAVILFQDQLDDALALERPELVDERTLAAALVRAWPRAKDLVERGFPVPGRSKFKNVLLQGKLPDVLGFDTAPIDLPGGPVAPFQTRIIEFDGERIVAGPAFHLVMDMSKPGAWYHVPGGASEKRHGPGYGRGVDEWRRGGFFPLGDPTGSPPNL